MNGDSKMTKKYWVLFVLFQFLLNGAVLGEELPPLPKGPLILTTVVPEQLKPDYWISRLPDAQQLLKTPEQIRAFNEDIRYMIPEVKDVFKLDLAIAGKSIRDQIQLEYKAIKGRKLFDSQNVTVPASFFEEKIKPQLALEKIPARIKLKWGAAIRATSVRALPTDFKMIEKVDDIEFDQLQFTLIKLWTPVGIYQTSANGEWLYIQAPYTRGWVKAKDIAVFSSRDQVKQYVKSGSTLVVTGESIPVYMEPAMTTVLRRASMGTVLPRAENAANMYVVWMPAQKKDGTLLMLKGYVSLKADVSKGFLPFTQKNVIRQGFKLLGARYGWGGMYNGRDCSGFTHDVFLPFGIDMPRDSRQQALIGTQLGHYQPFSDEPSKNAALEEGRPAITLLKMPLHIMIYLGEVNGRHYVIHSTWAERISMTSDAKNRINQVVVSDLSLNGKSRIGSLFDRTISINELD